MADYSDFFNDDDDEFLMSIPLERPAANTPSTSTSTSNNNSSSSSSSSSTTTTTSSTVKTSSKTFLSHFAFGDHYVDKFDGEGYDEVENLEGLTVQQLKAELGMKSGHANRLHRWLKKREGGDREGQNNIHRRLDLHQQPPARKKRRTSTSPSSAVCMAPEMKTDDDGDDDCIILIDDDNDEDEDRERISSTQIQNAARITAKDHHRHGHQSARQSSTPAKAPKQRTLRKSPSVSTRKVSRYPNRMIRTVLTQCTPHRVDMVRPTDCVRIYLELPYEQKEKGKRLGARWDRERKQWYVMSDHDASNGYDQMRHLVSLFGHDNSKYPFD